MSWNHVEYLPAVLTAQEAAELLRCSTKTIYSEVAHKGMPGASGTQLLGIIKEGPTAPLRQYDPTGT